MELCRHIHPDPEFTGEAEKWFAVLNSYMQELNADFGLYRSLVEVESIADKEQFSQEESMMLRSLLLDMQRNGIHMPPKTRQKIVDLQNKIANLGFELSRQISRSPSLLAIPKNQLKDLLHMNELSPFQFVEERQGNYYYKGSLSVLKQLLHHHPKGLVRKLAYQSLYDANPQSIQTVESLLDARSQLARMLGFVSYSHLASMDKLVQDPNHIHEFLMQLNARLSPKINQELQLMKEEKRKLEKSEELIQSWDVTYYCNQVRKRMFSQESLAMDRYLQLETCLSGMFSIAKSLFGLQIEEDLESILWEAWHPDVRKFIFYNEHGQRIGSLFLDLYSRPYKYPNSTHFTIQSHRIAQDGTHQCPVIAVMLNLEKNDNNLLHPYELQTLFHEFGHALHSILSATRFQNLAGTRTALDFVEIPSHLFEYFARDFRVLSNFAKDNNGKSIPPSLVEEVKRQSQLFSGVDAQTQIFYSLLDLELHSVTYPLSGRSTEILKTVQNKYTPFPYMDETAWHTRFGHLYGYASCYYSYLVAKVLAAKIWECLFSRDPLNRRAGEIYREKVLMVGGTRHPLDILRSILGNDMKADCFLKELGIDCSGLEALPDIDDGWTHWLQLTCPVQDKDSRFSSRFHDARFQRIPKKVKKVVVDKRFQSLPTKLLTLARPAVDKYGRPLPKKGKLREQEELEQYYLPEWSSSADSNEDEELSDQEQPQEQVEEPIEESNQKNRVDNFDNEERSETYRLAIVNMDWEKLKAVDILAALESFCPPTGNVKSVSIFPTEYGKHWIEKHNTQGPNLERFKDKVMGNLHGDTNMHRNLSQQEEGIPQELLTSELFREYELDKMKYYVAVVEFDSATTALSVYEQCDGTEFEWSGNIFDMRFIPDTMQFNDKPKDVAYQVPSEYEPAAFQTVSLQHTSGKFSWDDDDPTRRKLRKRRFTEQDLLEDDLKTYLASSDSDEEEDKAAIYHQIAAQALSSVGDIEEDQNLEMEATFVSGLEQLGQKILETKEQRETEAQESAWERRLRKMKERKEGKLNNNRKEMMKEKTTNNIAEDKETAELELLLMNSKEKAQHSSDDEDSTRNKKKKKRQSQKDVDDFQLDMQDPRFAALYRSHDFALDPTDPKFKKTPGTKKLLRERAKRMYDKGE
eukprot:jgi/Galph1/5961/GphlegSOOS_G4603.1